MAKQVIVVGGGLSGLSAAHTVLERGGDVLLLDKNSFLGGNSTKATSGINGALTRTQIAKGVPDSVEKFMEDTALSATKGKSKEIHPLGRVLCQNSASAVEWLQDQFALDLSLLGRLGGHSFPRTHRGKERFPGMTITYALMERYEAVVEKKNGRARLITKARVTKLTTGSDGGVTGVEFVKDGKTYTEYGPVILATGGYGADFSDDSLLKKYRPDLLHLPTTNGEHCTGDGIKFSQAIGADVADIEWVQVHPTGLVHPDEPNAKVKFLAAEALRGTGGLLIDADGKRFADELGRRDYVSELMQKGKGPFRLVLNTASSKEIEWHCKHYKGRGLMKFFNNGAELAKDMKIPSSTLEQTFAEYNKYAKEGKDPFGKKFFQNAPYLVSDTFYVAIVVPVVHYCMGGLKVGTNSEVINTSGKQIQGLWAAGEIMGGTHGLNRLGGSSLLDCVVFGRVAGADAASYLLQSHLRGDKKLDAGQTFKAEEPAKSTSASTSATKAYSPEEVAKHNREDDCWVIVNGQVLDVTKFLPDHPGGARAILLFAGKDATEEFNMLHKPEVIPKYAPESVIGVVKPKAKL